MGAHRNVGVLCAENENPPSVASSGHEGRETAEKGRDEERELATEGSSEPFRNSLIGQFCRNHAMTPTSAKHEGEDEDEEEDALSRVHDDAHPHALPPTRGIGGKDDVRQGGGD